ncbi:MAG: TonB family protein [Gemmatimonadetes bacterium]|nr:TonB family protein [Gemmatimonadota bacterium]
MRTGIMLVAVAAGVCMVPGETLGQRRCRPSEVQISPPDAEIPVGQQTPFLPTAYDASGSPCAEATFTWTTNNPRVATVDSNGIATAVSPGVAIITATTGTGVSATSGQATILAMRAGPVPRAEAAPPDSLVTIPAAPVFRMPVEAPPVIPALERLPMNPPTVTEAPTARDTSRSPSPGPPGTPGNLLAPAAPIDAHLAEEPALLLSHPQPRYPERLRQARVEGRVVVEVVLDTLGRPDPASLRVVTSAHPLFDAEASAVVLASRYRPARMGGRPVRVRILVPVGFSLQR